MTQLVEAYNVAESERASGVFEIHGPQNNPRIVLYAQSCDLHAQDDETPWCSEFVNWCVQQVGLKGTHSASALSWLRWGQKLERPIHGCIVVFAWSDHSGHVGFYVGRDPQRAGYILVLGGNQGDKVCIESFRAESVAGYRWTLGEIPTETTVDATGTVHAAVSKTTR